MDRRYELETLRRSIAMVQRGQLALRREDAAKVVDELIALRKRHDALLAELRRLLADE